MLEGFCEVNIKTRGAGQRYNRQYMNEAYRPIFAHDKRLWKLRHEPRMYEYRVPMPAPNVVQEKPLEVKVTAGGLLMLALLELLNCLSNSEGSGIEGGGK
jgi:hypothetical protein